MNKSLLVICETGITASSLLYKLAQEIESEKLNVDIDYAALPSLEEKLSKKEYDILLFTPQVHRYKETIGKLIQKYAKHTQVKTISDQDFQYMNVPHILHEAFKNEDRSLFQNE